MVVQQKDEQQKEVQQKEVQQQTEEELKQRQKAWQQLKAEGHLQDGQDADRWRLDCPNSKTKNPQGERETGPEHQTVDGRPRGGQGVALALARVLF